MSFGFIRLRKFPPPDMEPPTSIGTPSSTINGSLDALSDAPPRMRMVETDVGEPPPFTICTPAILPFTSSSGDETMPLLKSLVPTEATEPVRSLLRCVPYPMITTSLSTCESLFICTFSTLLFTGIVITLVSYPT